MNRSRWCCVGVVALVYAAGLGALAAPCTITVQPSESIQAAIDAASPGDVICLAEGTWQEHLSIGKSITLRGAGDGTHLRGYVDGVPVVDLYGSTGQEEDVAVFVAELMISGGRGTDGAAVAVENAVHAELERCTLIESRRGVVLLDRARVTMRDCKIYKNRKGIEMRNASVLKMLNSRLTENYGSAVYLHESAQATAMDSSFSGSQWGSGIVATGTTQIELSSCTVSDNNSNGLELVDSAQATLNNCVVAANASEGIMVSSQARVELSESVVAGNMYGIILTDGQIRVTDSTVADNSMFGLWLALSARAVIADSEFTRNTIGLWLGNSVQAEIADSLVSENRQEGIAIGQEAAVSLFRTEVVGNQRHGVALLETRCLSPSLLHFMSIIGFELDEQDRFLGHLRGGSNTIPGPDQLNGNRRGAFCPDELAFLLTEEGGELDRRE